MILPGGQVRGAFGEDCLPLGLLACQVFFTEEFRESRTLDVISLERGSTLNGEIEAGTPLTISWAVEPISKAMCDAIASNWADDSVILRLLYGVTDDRHWVCLLAPTDQLIIEIA